MLHIIQDLADPFITLLKDDPVRPSIPTAARVHDHALVFVLLENSEPAAVTCVAYLNQIPKTETARRFHLRNGARVLQDNDESVNYEY